VLLIACNGKNAYESFANQLRDWKPLTKRTPGCESSLLISLLQIWEATRLFQTETESISEHELVNIFMRKLGDVGSTRFFRSEMHRNSGTMTVERLLQVIELNNNIEDSTNSLASSIHFPDSHKYSQMEATATATFNRLQREQAQSTDVVDEQIKRRKTTQHFHRDPKTSVPVADHSTSEDESAHTPEPVHKSAKKRSHKRSKFNQAASTTSIISKESRSSSRGRKRAMPPKKNTCFWCSMDLDPADANAHLRNCVSRTHGIKKCRGCQKEFKISSDAPWLSADYVKHICHCDRLRCSRCPGQFHDSMVCPKSKCDRNTVTCTSGHARNFCDYDSQIPGWRNGK
jgi:hypothetical protein